MTPSLPQQLSWTSIVPQPDSVHGKPCARSSHGVSWVNGRLIVLGGEHVARTPIEDVSSTGNNGIVGAHWAADPSNKDVSDDTTTWQWRRLTSDLSPPSRIAQAQAVVPSEQSIYIFGGRAGITMEERAMNDLWKLDCSGDTGMESWTKIEPKNGSNPPEARSFHRMISIGSALYVFGGCSASGRLADLHRFDLTTQEWTALGNSQLKGRGGANLVPLAKGSKLAVIAGFAGEETCDAHVFDIASESWEEKVFHLTDMRPRSVCVAGSFPSLGYTLIFGGEVNPSDRGHEGAGGFENDIVLLDETSGSFIAQIPSNSSGPWPQTRGWSDGDVMESATDDTSGKMFIFGGLSGDDKSPERLDDLWVLNIRK